MLETLRKALRLVGKEEYVEVRLEKIVSTRLTLQNGCIEALKEEEIMGGYVRVFRSGFGWYFETFSGWENILEKIRSALHSASLKNPTAFHSGVVRGEAFEDEHLAQLEEDFRFVPFEEKVKIARCYAELMPEVSSFLVNSSVDYRDEFREIYLANSDGTLLHLEKPDISMVFTAVCRKGDVIELYRNGVARRAGLEAVKGLEALAKEVVARAASLLEARPLPGGVYDVVLDPTLAGVFIHEAFGHLSEADFLYHNERLKKEMTLGRRVASPLLSVFDDGSVDGLRGSSPYDDEGIPTRKTYLIREGILTGRLHSRETAFSMQEELTGNARTVGFMYAPLVRMTNTAIESGKTSKEELFGDIQRGVYAVEYLGGNTALELFTFSPAYGFLIENGKITDMVKNFVLSGNLFETLQKIDCIANDFVWNELGGCGKGLQMGLPTPTGSPHVRLRETLVGGSE